MPANPAPYLVDWLFEIGPSVPAGMSMAAIGWRDLDAWQALSGVALLPWEAKLLRQLSAAWVAESERACKPDCPAPWTPRADTTANRTAVARDLRNAFRALMTAQERRRPKPTKPKR